MYTIQKANLNLDVPHLNVALNLTKVFQYEYRSLQVAAWLSHSVRNQSTLCSRASPQVLLHHALVTKATGTVFLYNMM